MLTGTHTHIHAHKQYSATFTGQAWSLKVFGYIFSEIIPIFFYRLKVLFILVPSL